MARAYYDASGVILRFCPDDAADARYGAPPGAAGSVAFDESTNAALAADLPLAWGRYAAPGGVLAKDGAPVAVAADSQAKQDLDGLLNAASNALTANATYLGLAAPSNAQVAAQVRALTQQSSAVIRRLVLLNRLKG